MHLNADKIREAEKYRTLAFKLMEEGEFLESVKTHEKAKGVHNENNDLPGVAGDLTNIAIVYEMMGDHDKALTAHKEACKIDESIPFFPGLRIDYQNLVRMCLKSDDHDQADIYRLKLQGVHVKLTAMTEKAGHYRDLGFALNGLGRQEDAIDAHEHSKLIHMELRDYGGIAGDITNQAIVREQMGAIRDALRLHEEACKIDEAIGFIPGLQIDYRNLARMYSELDAMKSAFYKTKLIEIIGIIQRSENEAYARADNNYSYTMLSVRRIKTDVVSTLTLMGAEIGVYNSTSSYSTISKIARQLSVEYLTMLYHLQPHKETSRELFLLGRKIFNRVIDDSVRKGLEIATIQSEQLRSRNKLILAIDQNLMFIPFELMHDGSNFLCLEYPISRTVIGSLSTPRVSKKKRDKIRILLVASNPYSQTDKRYIPEGKLDEHADAVLRVLEPLQSRGNLETVVLYEQDAMKDIFLDAIKQNSFDVIHYVGHGEFDESNPQKSYLPFKDGNKIYHLDSSTLYQYARKSNLEMVFLNGCSSSAYPDNTSKKRFGDLMGISDALVRAGVPAVVGMRWPIDLDSSTSLAKEFYARYLQTGIADALMHSRIQCAADDSWQHPHWAAPLLVTNKAAM